MRGYYISLLGVLMALGAVGAGVFAWARQRDELPAAPTNVPIGAHASDLKLVETSGEVTLAGEMRGQPAVVLLFLGGWCPYCRAELRRFRRALEHTQTDGVTVMAVSPDPPESLVKVRRRLRLPFKVLSDPAQSASSLCNVAIHCVLLLDKGGTLRWAGSAEFSQAPVDYARVIRAARRLR